MIYPTPQLTISDFNCIYFGAGFYRSHKIGEIEIELRPALGGMTINFYDKIKNSLHPEIVVQNADYPIDEAVNIVNKTLKTLNPF